MHYFQLPDAAHFAAFSQAGLKLYDLDEYAHDLRQLFGLDASKWQGIL
jgi:hypothetical protein